MTDLAVIKEKLFCALLSDVMDALGCWDQAMPPRIRPLDEGLVMVGRARTALFADQYFVNEGENPYELEIQLIDSLMPGEIPVFSCGASGRIASLPCEKHPVCEMTLNSTRTRWHWR